MVLGMNPLPDGAQTIELTYQNDAAPEAGRRQTAKCELQRAKRQLLNAFRVLRACRIHIINALEPTIRGCLLATDHPQLTAAYIPFSSVSAALLMALVSTFSCSSVSARSPLSMASLTPGITTAAYPVYSPGA